MVPELIDQPLHGATVLRIYAAIAYAVLRWENRIALTGVQLQRGKDGQATLILDGVTSAQASNWPCLLVLGRCYECRHRPVVITAPMSSSR